MMISKEIACNTSSACGMIKKIEVQVQKVHVSYLYKQDTNKY